MMQRGRRRRKNIDIRELISKLKLPAIGIAYACFTYFSFEDTLIVGVVEETQVLASSGSDAPFNADVADDGIAGYTLIAGGDTASDNDTYSVVPEAFGNAIGVVGACAYSTDSVR